MNTITGDRQIWALTGLDMAAFCALAEPFTAGCQAEADARFAVAQPGQRRAGGGRKGVLAIPGQTLLFILFYLKTCPTFDVLGATFGLPRSKACEHAPRLAKALEHCLRTLGVLPARAIDSLAQMQALFADVPVLLPDATDHPDRRAHAAVDRPADYAGKKRPTHENTLTAGPARYIHYLGPTTCGATYDYQMLKNELGVNLGLLDLFALLADLGYLGLVRDYDVAPERANPSAAKRRRPRP